VITLELYKHKVSYCLIMLFSILLSMVLLVFLVYEFIDFLKENRGFPYGWIISFAVLSTSITVYDILAKKYTNDGSIEFHSTQVSIAKKGNATQVFTIGRKVKSKLILKGFDGQHILGDIQSLGQGSDYPNIRALTGLGNYFIVYTNRGRQKYKFYIGEEKELITLKNIAKKLIHIPNFKLKVYRE